MASAVDDLTLLAPPARPPRSEPGWASIEEQLGLRLPNDYEQLVEVYGQGSFDGFLWVLQPTGGNHHLDLLRQRDVRLEALRVLQASGEAVPHGLDRGQEELAMRGRVRSRRLT